MDVTRDLSPMPDLREYMTPEEFAGLPSGAHHAAWKAHAEGQLDSVPASASSPKGMRCYHRAQVLALLRETEAAR